MEILLEACFACTGPEGNIKARDLQDKDSPYLAEILDGTEIDGVRFGVSWISDSLEITMEGENLSEGIKPNYLERLYLPVPQILFKDPEARFTANVLNKFLRRAKKVLEKEPCNKGKKLPVNMILIKKVG